MEQLTKEHFERVVATLATKDDLTALATVKGLAQLEKNLSRQTQELARMVKKGFDSTDDKFAAADATLTEISKKLDVRAELKQLQLEVKAMKGTIGHALHVEL